MVLALGLPISYGPRSLVSAGILSPLLAHSADEWTSLRRLTGRGIFTMDGEYATGLFARRTKRTDRPDDRHCRVGRFARLHHVSGLGVGSH